MLAKLKKIFLIILIGISGVLSAQPINCLIPGEPGCSRDDFDRALQAQGQALRNQQYLQNQQLIQQQQQNFQYQQLQEMRRNNELLEQLIQQQQFRNMYLR